MQHQLIAVDSYWEEKKKKHTKFCDFVQRFCLFFF